ncbi:MAG: hypothetical protein HY391_03785 [Deltaproteobacteria bacterium]|nr:hypothetical protein [Deltaproteobacteria bacterium]
MNRNLTTQHDKKIASSSQKGQSATEFLLMSFLIFFFVFLFFQLAISMTVSEYFQYVAFMAARTNLVHSDPQKADRLVKETVEKMIGTSNKTLFGPFARLTSDKYLIESDQPENSTTLPTGRKIGVNLKFAVPLFVPFIPIPSEKRVENDETLSPIRRPADQITRPKEVELEVQAVLGKEPSCSEMRIACDNGE